LAAQTDWKTEIRTKARRAFNVAAVSASMLTLMPGASTYAAGDETPAQAAAQAAATSTVIMVPADAPIIPLPPAPSIQEILSADAEKPRNIFFEENTQSINEFRALRGDTASTGGLTADERTYIKEITDAAREDAKIWQVPRAVAATLRFASQQAGMDHDTYMTRLTQTGGIVTGSDRSGLQRESLFKFTVPTWLYLMKQHGDKHGFGFFADRITLHETDTATIATVTDANVLRQIISLRQNPRVSAIMGAEFMQTEGQLPLRMGFTGADYRPNQQMALDQAHMMTLGFDLGIRGADGVKGPLSVAARAEFIQMSRPLFEEGKTVSAMLEESAIQARADAQTYATDERPITPADAFSIRHASKVVGVEFGYMMELVSAESGFVTDVEASTSSATGLFQFIDNTWLLMIRDHGAKYGLTDLAKKVETRQDSDGHDIAFISNPFLSQYALSLRTDPRISALMGAEFMKENFEILKAGLPDRDITRTDQYLAHFLGSGNAVTFLKKMETNGKQAAATTFRAAARSNRNIFYRPNGRARSYQEIYDRFSNKFDTDTFEDAPTLAQSVMPPLPRHRPH